MWNSWCLLEICTFNFCMVRDWRKGKKSYPVANRGSGREALVILTAIWKVFGSVALEQKVEVLIRLQCTHFTAVIRILPPCYCQYNHNNSRIFLTSKLYEVLYFQQCFDLQR